MGSLDFTETGSGPDLKTAFNSAVSEAAYENGHGGYTGSLAEKDEVTLIDSTVRTQPEAEQLVAQLLRDNDPRISDKWGPAGALEYMTDGDGRSWLFFGYASY
ncbi:hypothetical protein OG897_35500 [Streptomyces sp. NBC_00237]|uniref:hypothetical protein n=1 Tax=Streptomyces sp. NBC_00237 TaxID=2975687 RepID=UPI00225AEC67|nr:hypothetical protein [Streptomyces sp. NBC_00237]MCX5206697.1 hypothetical protein [Streptomyces sp. NBC_00237]